MRRHAVTIVLVVVAIALGAWLFIDRDRVTESERKGRQNSVFPVWRAGELSQITVAQPASRADGVLVLERANAARASQADPDGDRVGDDEWRMTSPRSERADGAAVMRLLTTLEYATIARHVGTEAHDAFGLDSPRASGELRMGSLVVPFTLGAPSPKPEGSSYMRVGDEPTVVVTKEVADALLASFDLYRDRTVVPYGPTEIARLEVVHTKSAFSLSRLDERSFRIERASPTAGAPDPNGVLAARDAVSRMWAALADMRAERFPSEADAERLTAAPILTLRMIPSAQNKEHAEIVVGEACPGHPADVVVLRRKPTRVAACAPKDVVNAFAVDGASIVERHPFTLRVDEIEEARLEWLAGAGDALAKPGNADGANTNEASTPSRPIGLRSRSAVAPAVIELARKDVGFRLREPESRDLGAAEADAASELLSRIAASTAGVVRRADAPLAPVARVRLRAGEYEETLEVGPGGEGGGAVLRRVLDDARLEVDAAVVRRLVPRATSLRARELERASPRRVVKVVLRCGTNQELVDRGEGLRLVSPASYETDGTVGQLVDAIVRGKADVWVSDVDDGSFGFTKESCRVVLGFEDGNAPLTLALGNQGEGGVYATLDAAPGVFVAPRSLRDLAGRIYVSRASLRAPREQIESIQARVGGRLLPSRGDDVLRDALSSLYADRVVALGAAALIGAPSLVIEARLAETGKPRRIVCAANAALGEHVCRAEGTDALFAVATKKLEPFFPAPPLERSTPNDAGADRARDFGHVDRGAP